MQSRKGNINPDTLSFRRLQMYGVSLRNFWELQRLSELDTLELQNLDQEGVQCLSKLQHLKNLTVTHPMGMPLKALESLNTLEQLYFFTVEKRLSRKRCRFYLRRSFDHSSHIKFPGRRFPSVRELL